jgi:TrmH family RNA methyltransferase
MPVRIVQSKQNARLKQLRRAMAYPARDPDGLAGIEGPNLLEEALKAGLRISSIFVGQGFEHLLEPLALPEETEILLVPPELLDAALATQSPQPVAALVELPDWTWPYILGPHTSAPLIVVLAGIQDPGNLGTILRSAEAFGANGVIALPGTVSAWNPKSVRASAGSVFRVPVIESCVEDCFTYLREAGARILTTAPVSAQALDQADLTAPIAFLVGNEGNGVPEEIAREADEIVSIPCPGPVESLNAAVAAGIVLYEAARQRSEHTIKLAGRHGESQ